jgi:hypothetical protein
LIFIQTMRSRILLCFSIFFFAFSHHAISQQDTNFYKKYNNRLIVTFYSTQRYYEVGFKQKYFSDSLAKTSTNFKSTAPETFGFGLAYDKLSISYDYRTVQPDDNTLFKTGYNKVNSLALNFGGNRWILENSWRRFRGFYDNNTLQNFAGYDTTKPYFQNPSMQSSTLRSKIIVFSNHKRFAYKSAYGNNYRQMRSAATLLIAGNVYYHKLTSDTAFVPFYLREYYGDIAHVNKVNTTGISTCAGFAFNLVIFKRIFFNMTIAFGPDFQWRNSNTFDGQRTKSMYTTFSADSRFALGFNNRNVFITFYSANDINELKSDFWEVKQKYFSGGVNIGYRFRVKDYKPIKRMKEHKLYKMI